MNTQLDRHLAALEFDKILAALAQYTACPDARELALNLRPQSNLLLAQSLLNQTRDAHMLLARFGGPSFSGLKNVNNAVARAAAGSVLSMRELLDIASVLKVIRSLVQWRSSNAGVDTVLDGFFTSLCPNRFLESAITDAIISEEVMSDSASPELYDIRRKIKIQESKVRDQLDKFTHSSSYSKFMQENIITQRNGRYVVPVKAEHRGEVPGLVHDSSSSGATVFVEPMPVVEANNEIKVLRSKEKDEIDRILAILSSNVGNFEESIKSGYECAVELNLIFAKAQYAYSINASMPIMNDKGEIELRAARHPLIDKNKVVPLDIRLGTDFDTLVITGPNTGGKTVSIKTVGLLTLMAMSGLLIPAGDRSRLSVFDEVLADIGDEQSIEQNLSTFSAHMTNIIDIMKKTGEHSLVLIDELGAGTDPVEGAALAMAVLEDLHLMGAKIASTTHYAELKAYALETDRVENACCEFDVKTLSPTYRLLIGVPGKSNALAICSRLGMDERVVERAKEFVDNENIRFEDVVDKLEGTRRKMEEEREKVRILAEDAESKLRLAEQRLKEVDTIRERELDEAKSQARALTEQAKRESYALLNELDKLKKEQAKNKDAGELARRARLAVRKGISAVDAAVDPVVGLGVDDDDYELPRPLKIGDTVIIADIGQEAEVISLPDRNSNVEVRTGLAKSRVKLKKLRLVEHPKKKKKSSSNTRRTGVESKMNMSADSRLDVRGMTVEDCIMELDRYIDYMLRMGLNEFTVVHGKGTGALRAAVKSYLKKSHFVKEYRLGVYGEGEDGVTIVKLK